MRLKKLSALLAFGAALASASASSAETCAQGYVWREAGPSDRVCVPPAARDRVYAENQMAGQYRSPTGGAYGPNTCLSGYVWREAFAGDFACVTPQSRAMAAEENGLGASRRADAAGGAPFFPPLPIPQPGPGSGPGGGGQGAMPDLPIPPLQAPLAISPFFDNGVRPGVYMVRAVHSNLCIGQQGRGNETAHFASMPCDEQSPNRPLVAIVQQDGPMASLDPFSYSLRPMSGRTIGTARGGLCGGLAEDVVLGPMAIDVTFCRNVGGAITRDACQNGQLSRQRFALRAMRRLMPTAQPNWYRIHTDDRNPGILGLPHASALPHCISVRDSSRDVGAEHINWGCKNNFSDPNSFDQVFEFTWVASLPPALAVCRNTRR